MRSASTQEKTELIYQRLKGYNLRHGVRIEWYDNDTDEWKTLNDIDSVPVTVKGESKRLRYSNFSFLPVTTTAEFSIINEDGEYSPGSGTSKDGIIIKNRKIRIYYGYFLGADIDFPNDATIDNFDLSDAFLYFSRYTGSYLTIDEDNSEQNTNYYFNDLFDLYYGGGLYGGGTYTPASFFCLTKDFELKESVYIFQFSITSNTTKGTIYYNFTAEKDDFERSNSTGWTNAGATVNGTKIITVNQYNELRYLQVVIIVDGISWSDDIRITSGSVNYDSGFEWIRTFTGYMDDPVFIEPQIGEKPTVNITALDSWRKAIEIDVNLKSITNIPLDDVLKNVFDQIGIEYTSTSIANLSQFGTYTYSGGYSATVKAEVIIDDVLSIIQSGSIGFPRFYMYIEDDIIYLKEVPTDPQAVGALDYRHYIRAEKVEDSGRVLSLVRIANEDKILNAEEQLSTLTDSGTKSVQLTWTGTAYVTNITISPVSEWDNITLTEIEKSRAVFYLNGVSSATITVYGSKFPIAPGKFGQAGNLRNILEKKGNGTKLIIPFIQSDDSAQQASESLIDVYGDPSKIVTIDYPFMYLMPEINDPLLIWSRVLFDDNIYLIVGFEHSYVLDQAYSAFTLQDSSLNHGIDILYDDYEIYDNGLKYEMRLGPQGTEDQIDINKYKHNTGTA